MRFATRQERREKRSRKKRAIPKHGKAEVYKNATKKKYRRERR